MGWSGSHLWLIEARDMTWGMPGPDDNNILPASRTVLIDLVADTSARSFDYIYDLGDDWRHTVKIETPTPATAFLWRDNLGETGGGDQNGMRRPVARSRSSRFVPQASRF